jgi:hypothetical protein
MANHVSHAALPYPVKGARFTIQIPYLDADGDPTDPTTPDTERSIDGAAFADCTEEVTTITGSNGVGYITLTGDELNASMVALAAKVASGPKATLATLHPRVHASLRTGTAQAGAAASITLDSGADSVDDYYVGCIVKTTGGTGGGGGSGSLNNQARIITDYNGSTKVATVVPNWETNPDVTTTFSILQTTEWAARLADVVKLSGDATAADNAEADYDGTGYAKSNSTIGTTTTNTDMRGTDSAALASVCTEGRLAELDAANLPATTDDTLADTAVIGALGAGLTDITDRLPAALAKGTADSGTTTTMVDAALTEADTDYWKGMWIRFTSGTISGQVRLITGFTPASDTITFSPATTQAVSTNTYEILPAAEAGVVMRGTDGVDTATMRGTDSAALASAYTAARAGYLDNINGHTAQTGDNFARLGAPAGASVSADVAALQTDTDDIQARLPAALITGTADSGSTTTMVDAARTEADTDYWVGSFIRFTSGSISGQTRLITGFTPASDTITFAPAATQAVGTNSYEIIPASSIQTAIDFLEADRHIDTTQTPWDLVLIKKGTGALGVGTELLRQELKDTGGANITDTNAVVGQSVTP